MRERIARIRLVMSVLLALLIMATILSAGSAEVKVQEELTGAYIPNEILLGLKPEAARVFAAQGQSGQGSIGISSLDQLIAKHGVREMAQVFAGVSDDDPVAVRHGLAGVIRLTFPEVTDIFTVMAEYASDPSVEYVEVNRIYRIFDEPNDPEFGQQWALHNTGQTGGMVDADIDAPEAWDVERGNESVLIAVIDTGVDYTHSDLSGGRVRTDIDRDFVNGDDDAMDDHGHGTFVSGVAAADTNNENGIAGICQGCQVLPVKVLDSEGSGTSAQVAQGIQYGAAAGAHILNMSLGYPSDCGCSETVARAINYAYETGAFLVAASGNDSDKERVSYPAASPRVFAVGATDHADVETDWSNRAPGLHIVAPGHDIVSLDLDDAYRVASGTSAASPHVAGAAGLLLSQNPNLTNDHLWEILFQSADDLPAASATAEQSQDNVSITEEMVVRAYLPLTVRTRTTFGRLNAYRALNTRAASAVKAIDSCEGEASCPPGCAAEAALTGHRDTLSTLRLLRDFRDDVLRQTPTGQHWITLYEENRLELAKLLALDGDLRKQTRETISLWIPLIEALVNPDAPATAVLTETHLDAAETLVDSYDAAAGSELDDALAEARTLIAEGGQYVGLDSREAWKRLNEERD